MNVKSIAILLMFSSVPVWASDVLIDAKIVADDLEKDGFLTKALEENRGNFQVFQALQLYQRAADAAVVACGDQKSILEASQLEGKLKTNECKEAVDRAMSYRGKATPLMDTLVSTKKRILRETEALVSRIAVSKEADKRKTEEARVVATEQGAGRNNLKIKKLRPKKPASGSTKPPQ